MASGNNWKQIKLQLNYEINKNGEIRNLKTNKLLKLHESWDGYFEVRLMIRKSEWVIKLHRLVAEAFLPNPTNKPVVNHKDGNKKNNNANNLEWCTITENNNHALTTGLRKMPKGEKHPTSKLKELEVKEIFELYNKGLPLKSISNKYRISLGHLNRILNGERWGHLQLHQNREKRYKNNNIQRVKND